MRRFVCVCAFAPLGGTGRSPPFEPVRPNMHDYRFRAGWDKCDFRDHPPSEAPQEVLNLLKKYDAAVMRARREPTQQHVTEAYRLVGELGEKVCASRVGPSRLWTLCV